MRLNVICKHRISQTTYIHTSTFFKKKKKDFTVGVNAIYPNFKFQ